MLKEKVTVFVPSFNRFDFIRRVLEFYKDDDITVLVTDDTKTPFPDADKYPNLKYVQSGLPYQQSIRDPLNELVDTPYTLLCADDILIPVAAIEKFVDFLEKNPDYICAQGYQASMYYSDDGYYFKMGPQTPFDISSDTASGRMMQMMAAPPQYWGVFRTEALQQIFNDLPMEILNEPRGVVCEVLVYMATACLGKHKRLPVFFALHEDVPSLVMTRRKGFTHWEMVTQERNRKACDDFVKYATDILMRYEDLSYEEASLFALRGLELFALPQRTDVGRKTIGYRIKRELCSFWNKTGGKGAYRARKKAQQEAFEVRNNALLAAMSPECRAELDKVAEFVYRYPRCKSNDG